MHAHMLMLSATLIERPIPGTTTPHGMPVLDIEAPCPR